MENSRESFNQVAAKIYLIECLDAKISRDFKFLRPKFVGIWAFFSPDYQREGRKQGLDI